MAEPISEANRRQIAEALTEYLADVTVVYYKTHGFHWNIEGSNFYSLHIMLEKFYEEIWESMDEVAERIRALGEKVPPGLADLLKIASIKEAETSPKSPIMVPVLRGDYLALAKKSHDVGVIATSFGDTITTDMMTAKATFLEKAAWMLQSSTTD
jgi:starvation-inducible DNA-binding protein